MIYYIMVKFFYCFLVLLITSCSGTLKDMTCHINDAEDYLKTDLLCEIMTPSDLKLPVVSGEYKIPSVIERTEMSVGKKVNICPPTVIY